MLLVDRATGSILASDSFLNPQRLYGADVISRIRVATRGRSDRLRDAIRGGLRDGFARLVARAGIGAATVTGAAVAGNTTMMHLLWDFPATVSASRRLPRPLPPSRIFRWVSSSGTPACPRSILFAVPHALRPCCQRVYRGRYYRRRRRALPWRFRNRGGFVPGAAPARAELFIDFGTNAEMVLSAAGSFFCASAAAGPAFEGQSISCGAACVSGAVSSVYLDGSRFGYITIGAAKPVGLCGSAVVDLVALGLEIGLIRKDGALSPVCESSGIVLDPGLDIRLLAKDVREIQVARAAIRAGISLLLESAGLRENDVARVHLAGGFGYYLPERSALVRACFPARSRGHLRRRKHLSRGCRAHAARLGVCRRRRRRRFPVSRRAARRSSVLQRRVCRLHGV